MHDFSCLHPRRYADSCCLNRVRRRGGLQSFYSAPRDSRHSFDYRTAFLIESAELSVLGETTATPHTTPATYHRERDRPGSPAPCVAVGEKMEAKRHQLEGKQYQRARAARQPGSKMSSLIATTPADGTQGQKRGKCTEKTQFYPRGPDLGITALVRTHTQHMHVGAV